MQGKTAKPKCNLCEKELTSRGLTRHISSCLENTLKQTSSANSSELIYIVVSGKYNPAYFLHLGISGEATLDDLDNFLRNIWLECCGHMSAFSEKRWGDELDMSLKIKNSLRPGTELVHQYDFGSTTELKIKSIKSFQGQLENEIQILSRNVSPLILCDECGEKPAVNICTECAWGGSGWLCGECSKNHPCGDDMFLPVVNSPRVGVCAYTGED